MVPACDAGHAGDGLPCWHLSRGKSPPSCCREASKRATDAPGSSPHGPMPVRHLLGHLIWPTPRNMPRALAGSGWRRGHQSRASYFHTKRRVISWLIPASPLTSPVCWPSSLFPDFPDMSGRCRRSGSFPGSLGHRGGPFIRLRKEF